jgi:hypothetical protein
LSACQVEVGVFLLAAHHVDGGRQHHDQIVVMAVRHCDARLLAVRRGLLDVVQPVHSGRVIQKLGVAGK